MQPLHYHGCRPPSVLIVEDDEAIRSMLTAVLEDYGCQPISAANGAEALDLLLSHQFDVIVLDLEMPVMDGAEFYRQMQQRDAVVPTILVSAAGHAEHVAGSLGVAAVMPKPFDIEQLAELVLSLYKRP